tara:strand:- start:730 stop:966 length:237 start_codon:yes stop_codon:yes gene_type:complete
MKDVDAMWDLLEDVFPTGGTEDMYKTDLAKDVERLERESIKDALSACEGNQTKTAKMLGLGRTNLIAKIKKYNISAAS